ncbi:MAG: hypothetical protein MJ189_01295 [Coriobacteriales bacterium]|nr:hypothetical protein [Coriobacteriales bacterium]
MSELKKCLLKVHKAMDGGTLTLFTNRLDLTNVYKDLKEPLSLCDIELLAQSKYANANDLRVRFLENPKTSLLALRSFWEGFDAPGDTLRCVVLVKLPFMYPDDPFLLEVAKRENTPSFNYVWHKIQIPTTVINFKQAVGRLIRKHSDKGFLILPDSRYLQANYGKIFIENLPSKNIHVLPTAEIVKAINLFYEY